VTLVGSEIKEMMRILHEAGEKGDFRPFFNFLSDDVTYIDAYGIEHDKSGLLETVSRVASLWQDREYHMNRWVSQGNTVWIEWTTPMTHVNEFHGILPTYKRIENSGVWIMEFEAGKIIQIKEYEKKNEYLIRQLRE